MTDPALATLDPALMRDLARIIRSDDDEDVLPRASRLAATIVGARQAAATRGPEQAPSGNVPTVYLSADYGIPEPWDPTAGLGRLVAVGWESECLTDDDLASDPRYRELILGARPPVRGFLAMPLVDGEGQTRGRLALSDAIAGEFTATHQSLLAAFADAVSAALERRRLQEGLRDAQRQRQAFFGVVSHELRTPITTIYGGVRMLNHAGPRLSHDTREQLLEDITAESERLYRLVEDLLVLSRTEREALEVAAEPILLQHLLGRVAQSERQRRPWSRIVVQAGPDLPPVMGDATLVEQVVRNFLSNALKYAGADGPIEVSATVHDGWVDVVVADEGPGIDADPPEQVFELFFRTPEAPSRAQGAGIGLYVCRELIRAMGGETWVQRRDPRGTIFGFRLRSYAEDDAPTG